MQSLRLKESSLPLSIAVVFLCLEFLYAEIIDNQTLSLRYLLALLIEKSVKHCIKMLSHNAAVVLFRIHCILFPCMVKGMGKNVMLRRP